MHNLPEAITYLLAQKVIKVLEYSFFSSNRASKIFLMFCNDLLWYDVIQVSRH